MKDDPGAGKGIRVSTGKDRWGSGCGGVSLYPRSSHAADHLHSAYLGTSELVFCAMRKLSLSRKVLCTACPQSRWHHCCPDSCPDPACTGGGLVGIWGKRTFRPAASPGGTPLQGTERGSRSIPRRASRVPFRSDLDPTQPFLHALPQKPCSRHRRDSACIAYQVTLCLPEPALGSDLERHRVGSGSMLREGLSHSGVAVMTGQPELPGVAQFKECLHPHVEPSNNSPCSPVWFSSCS